MNPAKTMSKDRATLARRRFLLNCGKFAVVTPPVVTLMLSTSERSYAAVASGARGRGNNGRGNGGGDGVPGNSGNNPSPNAPLKRGDVVR
jgi:hypothetical protein